MPLLKRKRVLAAAIESTVGTAETLDATDAAFNAYDVMVQPSITVEDRMGQGGFGHLSGVPSQYQGTATFKTDVSWDGTVSLPSWAEIFLPACGWVDASGTFTPRSEAPGTNVKTLTIAAYVDGLKKMLAGCMGTWKLVAPTGRMAYIEWTFTGVWVSAADVAILAPTYPSASPIRYASATTTYNSAALCVENVSIDAGNNVIMRECAASASGFASALITDRYPKITANPESALVATRDPWGSWVAGTEAEFSLVLDGPSDSTIEFSAPKAQYLNVQEGDRNGQVIDDLEFGCNKNGATQDQELTIVFTEAS